MVQTLQFLLLLSNSLLFLASFGKVFVHDQHLEYTFEYCNNVGNQSLAQNCTIVLFESIEMSILLAMQDGN